MRDKTEFYAAMASRQFLAGTPYSSPCEAVEAGARRIEEWCECLSQARNAQTDLGFETFNPTLPDMFTTQDARNPAWLSSIANGQ